MAAKSLMGSDRRVAFGKNNALNNVAYGSTEQVISVTDLISEGPILGLAQGGKSVFLNNDAIFEDQETGYAPAGGETVSGTANSTTVTVNNWVTSYSYSPEDVNTQFILINDAYTKEPLTHVSTTLAIGTAETVGSFPTGVNISLNYTGTSLPTSLVSSATTLNPLTNIFEQNLVDGKGWAVISGADDRLVSGYIRSITSTNITIFASLSNLENLKWLEDDEINLSLSISLIKGIASITSAGTITLDSASPITFSKKSFSITAPQIEGASYIGRKYDSSGFQFKPGTVDQTPITTLQGVGSSTVSLSTSNVSSLNIGTTGSIIESQPNSSEIDSVQLLFNYPGGLYLNNTEKGTKEPAGAGYVIELFLQTNTQGNNYGWVSQGFLKGNSSISVDLISNLSEATNYSQWSSKLGPEADGTPRGMFSHGGKYTSGVTFTHVIDLEAHQPFTGFKLEVTRITESANVTDGQDGRGHVWSSLHWRGTDIDKWQAVQSGGLSQVLGVIKEKLNHPYTAMANVTFNAKQFPDVPSRTYDCFGMMVKIPSNYTTREEKGLNADGSFKNVNDLYSGLFTGVFKTKKVYTDNPAWVFYDILTNNRYGIGEFLREDPATQANVDIDIYSLYRVARYCDELVPDGKGGFEPRFRANIYLQKATDVYKVLKDMASIFRGMLYWMDGKVVPILDDKKAPVYSFNRSNVIDGGFDYQTTGSKTRTNQVVVSWNNPQSDYKLEPIIVEDRESIIRTGSIIKETATAFGCTSQGQAIRYGRWKLWTSINQTEIVTFKSAINTAFLAPGDVVTVQDNHDYNYRASGRVTAVGTGTASKEITLDRNALSGETGNAITTNDLLSVLVLENKIVLAQNSAVISGTTYNRGDVITSADNENGSSFTFTGDENAILGKINRAYDDAGAMLSLQYSKESAVYDCVITAVNSEGSILTITLPYTNAEINTGAIWGIKDSSNSVVSPKEYKILSITRENDNSFGFTAVEYYESKFDAIDNNFTLATEDTVSPPIAGDSIPAPSDIRVLRTPKYSSPGEEITVMWDPPANEFITEFEFESDIPGYPNSQLTTSTSYSFTEVPDGVYTFRVKSVSVNGKRSKSISAEVYIDDYFSGNWVREFGVVKGGYVNSPIAITNDSTANVYKLRWEKNPVLFYPFTETDPAANSVNLGTGFDFSSLTDSAYLYIDSYGTNRIKLVNHKFDNVANIDYWYDQLLYNTSAPSIWTSIAGTVSIPVGSSKVTGVGTSFTSLDITNILYLSNQSIARIAYIESDTCLYIDRTFSSAFSGASAKRDELNIDYRNDFLAGRLNRNSTNNTYSWQSFLVLDPDLVSPRGLVVDSNIASLQYNSDESQVVDGSGDPVGYSNITLTATGLNFLAPEFKVTGAGFSATSGSADTGFTLASSGTYSKVIDDASSTIAWSNGSPLQFTVQVREKNDPSNSDKSITKTFSIFKTKNGSIGLSGKTVKLEAEDYTILYNAQGQNPSFNDQAVSAWSLSANTKLNFAALFRNFTTPIYRVLKTVGGTETVVTDWTDSFAASNAQSQGSYLLTYEFTPSATYSQSDYPVNIKIQAGEKPSSWSSGTAPTTIEAVDSISVVGVKEGTGGVVISNPNAAHSYTTDKNGNVGTGTTGLIPNSGTLIEVLIGGVTGDYDGNSSAVGRGENDSTLEEGQWYIASAAVEGASDLTIGSLSVSGDIVVIGSHTAVNTSHSSGNPTDDNEVITYTIKAKVGRTVKTLTTQQSLSKSKTGADGSSVTGPAGSDGEPGARTVGGVVYYQTAQSSAPTIPAASSFSANFTSGTFNYPSGWGPSPPTAVPATSATYWYFHLTITESGTWSSSGYPSVTKTASPGFGSSATQGIGFTGLVTFSGNNLVSGSSTYNPFLYLNANGTGTGTATTTTINGAHIRTGTITADRLTAISSSTVNGWLGYTAADDSEVLAFSTTEITGGKIVLKTNGLILGDNNTTSGVAGTNRIIMDTTSGNNAIKVYDNSSSNPRVIIGKLT